MTILAFDHIQIAMPAGQEDAARAFYSGLLGMTETPKPAPLQARGGVWFRSAGAYLHLGVEAGFMPAKKAHPCFIVDDLEALRWKLTASGARVTPDETLPGVRRFYADDPFGNRIEFIQDGDGFSQG